MEKVKAIKPNFALREKREEDELWLLEFIFEKKMKKLWPVEFIFELRRGKIKEKKIQLNFGGHLQKNNQWSD